MRVAVIGGNLQGLEATYLAHKAGWEVVVVDKDPRAPAANLAEEFVQLNIISNEAALLEAIKEADFIIPAVEDLQVLDLVRHAARQLDIPLAYDPHAYSISCSKTRSKQLFTRIGIPTPLSWNEAGLPLIVKPAESSGSRGVRKLADAEGLKRFLDEYARRDQEWVVEEFIPGAGFSVEVIGCGEEYRPLQVTEVEVDGAFDAKRIIAPANLTASAQEEFLRYAEAIAAGIKLVGIMDVEAILGTGGWRLLEIDARLPSQTPTAVYHSTGLNMVEMLYQIFTTGRLPAVNLPGTPKAVIYQQIQASKGLLEVKGEHVISKAGPLRLEKNFFGADEALTNYRAERSTWVAVLIITGEDHEEVVSRSNEVLRNIAESANLYLVNN